jgi:hypothetical protein
MPPDFDKIIPEHTHIRHLVEEPEGLREESDEELRARILGRAPRAFDEFALWEAVLIESMKLPTPPRVLSARRWGVGNYFVMAEADHATRAALADRLRYAVPAWVNVSVVEPQTHESPDATA